MEYRSFPHHQGNLTNLTIDMHTGPSVYAADLWFCSPAVLAGLSVRSERPIRFSVPHLKWPRCQVRALPWAYAVTHLERLQTTSPWWKRSESPLLTIICSFLGCLRFRLFSGVGGAPYRPKRGRGPAGVGQRRTQSPDGYGPRIPREIRVQPQRSKRNEIRCIDRGRCQRDPEQEY